MFEFGFSFDEIKAVLNIMIDSCDWLSVDLQPSTEDGFELWIVSAARSDPSH